MWSEQLPLLRATLKRLPTRSKLVRARPGENAGIIDIATDGPAPLRSNRHNHPSFIEPFQGATTGVGGILRDIFTMGARPSGSMDSLRFGPITADAKNQPSCARADSRGRLSQNKQFRGRVA